mgnify:CR=1 FL=1
MLKVLQHPLITHKLTQMRKKETGTKDFRQNLDEIAGLMAYEISRDFPLQPVEIETPVAKTTTYELAKEIVLVPILRAGLGMVNGICDLIPTVKIAHVGLYRDEETLEPHTYFEKYPKEVKDAIVMIVDPMLATGSSLVLTYNALCEKGGTPARTHVAAVVASEQGLDYAMKNMPRLTTTIWTAVVDEELTSRSYIVPGIGDAGDLAYGEKI